MSGLVKAGAEKGNTNGVPSGGFDPKDTSYLSMGSQASASATSICYCHGVRSVLDGHIPCPRLLSVLCTVVLAAAVLATLGTGHFPTRPFIGTSVRAAPVVGIQLEKALTVADQGVGLRLVRLLTEQLQGEIRMENHHGIKFFVTFNDPPVM